MRNKGISLITLVVTIMVMLILIGVVGAYSFDTINEGYESVSKRELANVREYVLNIRTSILNGDFSIDPTYESMVLNSELAYILCDGKLTESEINSIVDVNSADIDLNYKYYYIQAAEDKFFENTNFSGTNITVQDAKGNYIINFYTGTIILLNEDNATVEGLVKGLGEILLEIE